jgi:hypothetical protein
MRLLLALMAVIGLLLSPAAAAAAQVRCHEQGGIMTMAKADMPGMVQADSRKADPCCDPAKHRGETKHHDMSCLQTCAAMCGVVAALPSMPFALIAPPHNGAPEPARLASLKPHEPSQLERPPRSIA